MFFYKKKRSTVTALLLFDLDLCPFFASYELYESVIPALYAPDELIRRECVKYA